MVYILSNWIINKENTEKIHDILDVSTRDLVIDGVDPFEEAIKALEVLGEFILVEKLKKNEIYL